MPLPLPLATRMYRERERERDGKKCARIPSLYLERKRVPDNRGRYEPRKGKRKRDGRNPFRVSSVKHEFRLWRSGIRKSDVDTAKHPRWVLKGARIPSETGGLEAWLVFCGRNTQRGTRLPLLSFSPSLPLGYRALGYLKRRDREGS